MLADIEAEACKQVLAELADQGIESWTAQQDVTDEASWQSIVADTVAQLGGLNVVVNEEYV